MLTVLSVMKHLKKKFNFISDDSDSDLYLIILRLVSMQSFKITRLFPLRYHSSTKEFLQNACDVFWE